MSSQKVTLFGFLFVALIFTHNTNAAKRVRVRPRPIEPENEEVDYDNSPDTAVQYYQAEPRQSTPKGNVVLIADDEYNGYYGQQSPRQRADYRPSPTKAPIQAPAPRSKNAEQQNAKTPPVQTIRNYSKVNDDGSFTFGYEAADGSFKEETRGTDCVVRGKYGYVDPDGNKREFTYVSGNPCDPNNPDETQSSAEQESEEDAENENIPQNYPRRPVSNRPQSVRPLPTTTSSRPPTTVFQNTYAHAALPVDESEEEDESVQYVQQPKASVTRRPYIQNTFAPQQEEVRHRQRINTTPSSNSAIHQTSSYPVSITPRPSYRAQIQTQQTQPPATTYRPQLQVVTDKQAVIYSRPALPATTPNSIKSHPKPAQYSPTPKGPIDFAAEFQKFQQEHNIASTAAPTKQKSSNKGTKQSVTVNPIYESQLVYDPSTGQYDSALYQQLPQTDGDFSLSQRIQPYVQQQQYQSQQRPQLVTLEQLQQQSPIYQRPVSSPRPTPLALPQISQEIYQKQHDNIQVLNSQQLFQQQQELQQAQLQQDRIEAAQRTQQLNTNTNSQQNQQHRFQVQRPQSFYYIQPTGTSTGQIDDFLRGHNIEY